MKPSSKILSLLLSPFLFANANAVLVYWIDVDADTLTITGEASGQVTDGGVEWIFFTGTDGDSDEQLSLISGAFNPNVDVLAFLAAGEADGFFVGSELTNGDETFLVDNAVFNYGSLSPGVETFIEDTMLGNDIPLFAGTGFGDIVYIPEPSTLGLVGIALLGLSRRRR